MRLQDFTVQLSLLHPPGFIREEADMHVFRLHHSTGLPSGLKDIIIPTINSRCAFTLACVRACECMCVALHSVNIYIGIWCHESSSWNVMEVECCVACEWGSCSGIHAPYHVDGNHFQMTSYPKYKTYPRSEGLFTCLAISSLLYMNMLWMWCHLKMIGTCLTLTTVWNQCMHDLIACLHLLACLLAHVHHPWEIHFYGTPTWTV